jgi:hypothetical protein
MPREEFIKMKETFHIHFEFDGRAHYYKPLVEFKPLGNLLQDCIDLGIASNDLKKAKDDIELKQRRVDRCERQLKNMRERRKFNHFLNSLTQNNIVELGSTASSLEDAEDEIFRAHSATTTFCIGDMIKKVSAKQEWTMDGEEDLTAQPHI